MVANTFNIRLAAAGQHLERSQALRVLQLNLGRLCNMRCSHCHVGAGPDQGATQMPDEVVQQCIAAMDRLQPQCVDLTGGRRKCIAVSGSWCGRRGHGTFP
ncbi:hypothetical protein [Candidatus Synechococcus spongiarum]|uniref:hypothetical protein n=1 Tax=Candidatus Synechococcus spongiarum TaxID=431041 RepID=UPI0004AF1A08|nr:hypothetical protein [Candidatus Synechococcus spongiarum]